MLIIKVIIILIFYSNVHADYCSQYLNLTSKNQTTDNFAQNSSVVYSTTKNEDAFLSGFTRQRSFSLKIYISAEIAFKLRLAMIGDVNTLIRVPIEDYKYLGLTKSESLSLINAIYISGQKQLLTYSEGWIPVEKASDHLRY